MIVNFKIEDNFSIQYEGRHIDLHNNFNFIGYQFKIKDRQVILTWTKSDGAWIQENEFSKVTFIHSGVSFINTNYDNKESEFPDDDKCLANISFFPSAERTVNDSFIPESSPKGDDDIIYVFESNSFIRIGCDKIQIGPE